MQSQGKAQPEEIIEYFQTQDHFTTGVDEQYLRECTTQRLEALAEIAGDKFHKWLEYKRQYDKRQTI